MEYYRTLTASKLLFYANILTLFACMRVQLNAPAHQAVETPYMAMGVDSVNRATPVNSPGQTSTEVEKYGSTCDSLRSCNSMGPVDVPLAWDSHAGHLDVGYQFLGPLPVSVIEVKNPDLHLLSAIEARLALRGRRPITTTSNTVPRIQIVDLALHAFDFIFIRKIVCSARVRLHKGNTTTQIQSHASSYHEFAFLPELKFVLKRCLSTSAEKILEAL